MSKRPPEDIPVLAVAGNTGLKENSGYIREEFHPRLRGGNKAFKIFTEMYYNEGNIASSDWAIESMLRGTPRSWRLNESGHPQAAEAQEFADQAWGDMESTPQQVISEAWRAALFGFSYLEILTKLRKGDFEDPRLRSSYNDGRYGWRDLSPRAQESRDRWEFDESGNLLGMWQHLERTVEGSSIRFIPRDRACHFRFRAFKDNPEGFAFPRPAYPSYYYAKRLREVEAIGIERNIAGLPYIQAPPQVMNPKAQPADAATRSSLETLGKKVRMDHMGYILMPSETDRQGKPTGFKFELLSASGKNNAEADPVIRRYQNEMLKVYLTQFLAFGISQEGSHAIHSSATSMLGYAIRAVNQSIDEEINRSAVPYLMRLNRFPREAWPKLESSDVEKASLAETGAFLSQMVGGGVMDPGKDLDDWGRKQLGLDAKEGPSLDDMLGATVGAGVNDLDPTAAEPEAPAVAAEGEPVEQEIEESADEQISEPPMMDLEEAAEYFGIDPAKLRRAFRRGKLPGIQVGNTVKLKRDSLMAMMEVGQ
jgi:excisionase family DNA binding protein